MPLASWLPGFLGGNSGHGEPPAAMAPDKMKQWTTGLDGIDKLQMEEADVLRPGDGEVLVKIHAVSLNYRDKEGEFVSGRVVSP